MAEKLSTFLKVFGDTPILRVMDFLIIHKEFDYSMKDLARFSGVGYSTLKLFWPNLEQANIVIMAREVGKAKMYHLNFANLSVKRFNELYWATTHLKTKQLLEKKTIKIKA